MGNEIDGHYAGLVEADRLTRSAHGRLEFLRTQELLRRELPDSPASVLDVGGGTGVHAAWLASDGYHVHVIDPVDDHVAAAEALPGVTAEVGDARRLTAADDSFDAVLLLGPLYHLIEAGDRALALREAARVARPGGVVAAAAISRYLSLLETGVDGRLTEDLLPSINMVIETGEYDMHIAFVTSHWHTADDLRLEMAAAGLTHINVFGVEGPAWPTLDAVGLDEFDRRSEAALRCARVVETDPNLLHASAHLLGVGST